MCSKRSQSLCKWSLEATCERYSSDDLNQRCTHFGSRVDDLQATSQILEIATKIYPRERSCRQIAVHPLKPERQVRPSTKSGVASFYPGDQTSSRGSDNSEQQSTLTTHRLFFRNHKPAHRLNIHLLERYRECLTSKCSTSRTPERLQNNYTLRTDALRLRHRKDDLVNAEHHHQL
ncbi:hypothetical protein KC19_11G154000 [Ceratodon purpureus]|uniref:Uncharacterized protein n=1 Tax=Ceratodon purpureus TaxID=3225 RepID=A0A8T0GHH4_CERPU|nr:hypothetical protein KC19_11G154000 [Ceratodon purpureus]